MSILKRAYQSFFSSAPRPPRNPGDFWPQDGAESYTGMTVSHETAMTCSAVYAAVRLISFSTASLPIGSHVAYGAQTYPRPKPPWMVKPNSDIEWPSLAQQMVTSILLDGNATSAMIWGHSKRTGPLTVQELWPVDPRTVGIDYDKAGRKVFEVAGETLTQRDILHVPGLLLPGGVRGLSPVEYARQTIGLALGAEKLGARQLKNAATPNVIITSPKQIEDAKAREMADRFDRLHAGLDNTGKTAVLGGDAKINTLTLTNEQMQFLETRQFQIADVARWFGVPPHMIGDVTNSTSWGTGIEQQTIAFVVFTLTPWLKMLESAFKPLMVDWAMATDDRGDTDWFCKFNVNGLMRGDMAARASFYRELSQVGAISPNWILAKEDENPFRGGDGHYLNSASLPIGPDGLLIQPAPPEPAQSTSDDMPQGDA